MKRTRPLLPLTLILLCVTSSCSLQTGTPVPAEPSMTPLPADTIATPSPEITLELEKFEFVPAPDGTLFLGTFENSLASDLVDLRIDLDLWTPDAALVASQVIRPVPDSLAPGERAGVWAYVDSASGDLHPSLSIASHSSGPLFHSDVDVAILDTRQTASGETILLGELTNRQVGYGRLNDLILLPESIGEGSQGIAKIMLANRGLPPGEAVPFASGVLGEVPEEGWQVFIDASPSGTPDRPPLEIFTEPVLRLSEQGRPFYILQLRNLGSLPRWVSGEAVFSHDDTVMALVDLSTPVPILPGEIRPISLDEFIGLPTGFEPSPEAFQDWQVELKIDSLASRPALAEVQPLRIEVLQFEVIGDLIFMRGELSNDNPGAVEHPSALITARDIGGRLLNSAWSTPRERLAPGASTRFELTMLLPAGTKAELSEFDLQGFGTAAP